MDTQCRHLAVASSVEAIYKDYPMWYNPLLVACSQGDLTLPDFRYLFTQYYHYTRNFTRLLGTMMVKCENDILRAKLTHNLWEEGGESNLKNSHTEIFRAFLIDALGLKLDSLEIETYTKQFVNLLVDLCLKSDPVECAAILAYATEGIVPRLYTIFREGLIKAGIQENQLLFFNLHIACDDEHAETLTEIAKSYGNAPDWYYRCNRAISKAMELRDEFFKQIYYTLQKNKIEKLVNEVLDSKEKNKTIDIENHLVELSKLNNKLYENINVSESIHFQVDQLPFDATTIDPRVLTIRPNSKTEMHSHAHESIFFVISGLGKVTIGNSETNIKKNSFVYIPRWVPHQTMNVGEDELIIFAVTDFNFTRCFSGNTADSYRQKKQETYIE